MKAPQNINHNLVISTNISEATKKGDFPIKLFPYSPELDCEGAPLKTIKNFDELIEFFEKEEEI